MSIKEEIVIVQAVVGGPWAWEDYPSDHRVHRDYTKFLFKGKAGRGYIQLVSLRAHDPLTCAIWTPTSIPSEGIIVIRRLAMSEDVLANWYVQC